jgi:hypothetical protein
MEIFGKHKEKKLKKKKKNKTKQGCSSIFNLLLNWLNFDV